MRNIILVVITLVLQNTAFARSTINVTQKWGGKGISIAVYSNGQAGVEFDCAHGTINSFKITKNILKSEGTLTQHTGMRPQPDHPPRIQDAGYSASINKKRMNLIVRIDGKDEEYSLTKGLDGVLMRCM